MAAAAAAQGPCAACKSRRQKCTEECIFAPYFPPEDPDRFENVHNVFGASNVSKILHKLAPELRQDAVICLDYQARCRILSPVYGCVGLIFKLQRRLNQARATLEFEKKQLDTFMNIRQHKTQMLLLLQQQQHIGFCFEADMNINSLVQMDENEIWSLLDDTLPNEELLLQSSTLIPNDLEYQNQLHQYQMPKINQPSSSDIIITQWQKFSLENHHM